MSSFNRVWHALAGSVAGVFAPADCHVCSGPLLAASRTAVCEDCLDRVQPETATLCTLCGERLAVDDVRGAGISHSLAGLCCAGCEEAPPRFKQARAFAAYDGALRQLIRLHKFEGVESLADTLGACLAGPLLGVIRDSAAAPVSLIAVPLFGRKRRYNQSAQIADAALRQLRRRREMADGVAQVRHSALRRVRATTSQSHLSPAQRRQNVHGAFAVTTDVQGWHVVLVDDVFTTGATVEECARTLLRAGAATVRVATVARTQPLTTAGWGVRNERTG